MKHEKGSEIASLIREINATLNAQLREAFKENNLTPPQMMIMFMLSEEKKLKVSEISTKMNLANSTVSGIIDRLEKLGYVQRVRSEVDRRVVHVEPSKQAEELHKLFHDTVTQFLGTIVEDATDKQITEVMTGLNTLQKLLNREKQKD
ncbi:MarR family transcriptional regulator [Aquibacillus halophilus]|uniref:MarR family transcriptional regulator n=1 Tax=Aquibacillus halophilus TaxID=930132 RepID=A0A6A8DEZ9_9BACI|nr:MarR family transcriptional regulator [Aquibacillus halophilus]MRH44275.1 MarR family transcriptional regulator [Aquibacillus halophilus]